MTAFRVIFRGRVQGVGFRHAVWSLAHGFEVCGWVRNLPDGSVEMEVAGESAEVGDFIREITLESSVAHHVRSHHATPIPASEGMVGFSIRRD